MEIGAEAKVERERRETLEKMDARLEGAARIRGGGVVGVFRGGG